MNAKQKLLEARMAALAALRWLMTTPKQENDAAQVAYLQGTLERISGLLDNADNDTVIKITRTTTYSPQPMRDEYNKLIVEHVRKLSQ